MGRLAALHKPRWTRLMSWDMRNASTYLEDGDLWTVCKESHDIVMACYLVQRGYNGPGSLMCDMPLSSVKPLDVSRLPRAPEYTAVLAHIEHLGKRQCIVIFSPEDLFILDTLHHCPSMGMAEAAISSYLPTSRDKVLSRGFGIRREYVDARLGTLSVWQRGYRKHVALPRAT